MHCNNLDRDSNLHFFRKAEESCKSVLIQWQWVEENVNCMGQIMQISNFAFLLTINTSFHLSISKLMNANLKMDQGECPRLAGDGGLLS